MAFPKLFIPRKNYLANAAKSAQSANDLSARLAAAGLSSDLSLRLGRALEGISLPTGSVGQELSKENSDELTNYLSIEKWGNQLTEANIIYDMSPVYIVDTTLVPWVTPQVNLNLVGLSGTLNTTLVGNTTINLIKNGSVVESLTIASGTTYSRITFPTVVIQAMKDNYSITVSAVGTGIANLGGEIELL